MKENYYAFLICILRPVTIEKSFQLLDGHITKRRHSEIKRDDVQDMLVMKQQGMTYMEIGRMYGMTNQAVYCRLKRYKAKEAMSG